MNKRGAELIVEALKKENVEVIFGFPGGVVIPIFDVLYSEPSIHVVLTRHEQGAVHAADGYARSTGKTGVCLVTSGPGATNTITGLATANFDSVPLVCITGQVERNMIGNDAFQEADTVGITRPITKHNYLVTERAELGPILKSAFCIANSGRPGPVVVDIPKDISLLEMDDEYPEHIDIRGYKPEIAADETQLRHAAEALSKAQRPVFFIGGGLHIADAEQSFRGLVDKVRIPVVSSLMGIGILPSDHPLYLGMIGMHGAFAANMAVTETDLLFSIGVRFDDRATCAIEKFAPKARIIHIDIDPVAIARNVPVAIPIICDADDALQALLPMVRKADIDEWLSTVQEWKASYTIPDNNDGPYLSPGTVIKEISNEFPNAIISTEVGQNQMWAALFYRFSSARSWLTSGGLGTMGYGFPAAVGAQIGHPDRRVIDIAGDGSIQMNIQEMATAVNEGLPVIVCILNNSFLGMVRQWQELFFEKRYSSTRLDRSNSGSDEISYKPDFVKLADAYGGVGIRVVRKEEIGPALRRAKEITDRPIIIEFIIEHEANVFPMVPPGAGLDEMLLGREES